jgi:hypothetical protein
MERGHRREVPGSADAPFRGDAAKPGRVSPIEGRGPTRLSTLVTQLRRSRGAVAAIVLALGVNTFSVADVTATSIVKPTSFLAPAVIPGQRDPLAAREVAEAPSAAKAAPTSVPAARIPVSDQDPASVPARSIRTVPSSRPVAVARTRGGYWSQLRDGLTVRGMASWYPGTRGYGGTAHVAMPGARYLVRGTQVPTVRVCVGDVCRTVPVVDSCACYWNEQGQMIIDLSLPLVRALGLDPSLGIYPVTITFVGG